MDSSSTVPANRKWSCSTTPTARRIVIADKPEPKKAGGPGEMGGMDEMGGMGGMM